jgi:hypothetical protein
MPTTDVETHPTETEARFAVGWQKLTRDEFLEAIAVALLDKVRNHQLEQAEKSSSSPPGAADLAG